MALCAPGNHGMFYFHDCYLAQRAAIWLNERSVDYDELILAVGQLEDRPHELYVVILEDFLRHCLPFETLQEALIYLSLTW